MAARNGTEEEGPASGGSIDGAALSRDLAGRLPDLSGVEILCGIPSLNSAGMIGHVVRAVEAGLRRAFPEVRAAIVVSDAGSEDGTVDAALEATTRGDEEVLLIAPRSPLPRKVGVRYQGISGKGSALRTIFTIARIIGARACAVVDSDLRSIAPWWIESLVAPVLEHGRDLVAPMYARHKHDATITNALAYPLTAALYGRRLLQPIGGEFGFSGRLAAHWAEQDVWSTDVARFGVDIWMTTTAVAEGFEVGQAFLGAKLHQPKDPGEHLDAMFRQVAGPLFSLADRYPDRWMEVDSIVPVPMYGFPAASATENVRVNEVRLAARFMDGYATYEPVWREVLSEETFSGILGSAREAARLADRFALPIRLWARIVYDYLVAHRSAAIDRALLLDSMLPLFMARTATFVREVAEAGQREAEAHVATFADVFLEEKAYLRARWAEAGPEFSRSRTA